MKSEDQTLVSDMSILTPDELETAAVRVRDRLWAAISEIFDDYQERDGLTYAALGRRVGRRRSQIQRWLGAPCNMSATSAGILAEGLDADFVVSVKPRVYELPEGNYCHPVEAARAFTMSILPLILIADDPEASILHGTFAIRPESTTMNTRNLMNKVDGD